MEKENHALLSHLVTEVSKLREDVTCVRVDQAEIKVDLKYHIKRTDLLEEHVKSLKWIKLLSDGGAAILRFLRLIK